MRSLSRLVSLKPGDDRFLSEDAGLPDAEIPALGLDQKGDVVVSEITATFFDYGGQVLRSFAVGGDPTPLYRKLHDAFGTPQGNGSLYDVMKELIEIRNRARKC